MFDTIKLGIPITLSLREIQGVPWTRVSTKTVRRNGVEEQTNFCEYHDESYVGNPFIRYTYKEDDPTKAWFKVEVSLPKLLYGSNVYEITENDIAFCWQFIKFYLSKLLKKHPNKIPPSYTWIVEKLHISKNFYVGQYKQNYLRCIEKSVLPQHKTSTYCERGSDNLQTVEWIGSTRKVKIYDKLAEVLENRGKHLLDDTKKAEGILRLEIELSYDEIVLISPSRTVSELLREDIATQKINRELYRLGLSKNIKYTSIEEVINKIESENIKRIRKTSLIAFVVILITKGESGAKKYYAASTYKKNMSSLRKILNIQKLIITDIKLPPFSVEYGIFKKRNIA
ncbi:hypothetical protein [Gracilibacillus xinjiangensis]|uniref:Uncharacterized protein n=1 Tax=Gracilibacillus xinjiangensis TaxID=1193282 RepID=A0ABV8WWE8_9BACI